MAFGILTIMAGFAYILWKAHEEYPGTITAVLLFCTIFVGPLALIPLFMEINNTVGIIFGLIVLVAYIVGGIYAIANNDKIAQSSAKETVEIWSEVYALPTPDADTLRKYKIANKIPVYPEDSKVFNDAAIHAWQVDEYNKRLKERHWIVF